MTVKELIQMLRKHPPDHIIRLDSVKEYIDIKYTVAEWDSEDNDIVVIVGEK